MGVGEIAIATATLGLAVMDTLFENNIIGPYQEVAVHGEMQSERVRTRTERRMVN